MPANNRRMQDLQDDLKRTASDLDILSRALHGHAQFMQHSVHRADAVALTGQIAGLQATASELREIAKSILP